MPQSPSSDLHVSATPQRTLPKLGWHFWFVLIDLLSGFCLDGVASGQNCPGGRCPSELAPSSWPATPTISETPPAAYQRAIVRVGREDRLEPGASYSGAGTYVAQSAEHRGLVLTAAHVVDQGGGRIWVDFGRGRQTASLLGRDANLDLAALVIANPPTDVPTIPVAGEDEWPPAGEHVEVIGYGGGRFRHFSARVRGYTVKETNGNSQLVVSFQPISGDSGGAILYRQKLVGILWGGPCGGPQLPAYETHATCCIYIRQFLDGIGVQLKPRRPPAEPPPTAKGPGTTDPFVGGPAEGTPPQAPPPATPQTPPPSADSERLAAIEKRLAELAAQLSAVGTGPAGAPGTPGPQGLPGPAGPAGKDADPAVLSSIANRVATLEKKLRGKLQFSLQVDSQTGKILSTSSGSP